MNTFWIFVCSHGFVLTGRVVGESYDAMTYAVEDAQIVVRWGTTKGIGELREGRKPETRTDWAGSILLERSQVIFRFEIPKAL